MIQKIIIVAIVLFFSLATYASAVPRPTADKPAATAAVKLPEGQVILDGKPLLIIRGRILSFDPADRARAISDRLAKLVKDPLLRVDSITAVDGDSTTDIVSGDLVLMTVTDADAATEGQPRKALADFYVRIFRTAVDGYHREYSFNAVLLGSAYAFLATVGLIVLLVAFNRFFPKLNAKIEFWRGTRIRSIHIQSLEIIHADRIAALLIGIVRGIRMFLILMIFYFYIPLLLSFFPWTRGFSADLLHFIISPFAIIAQAIWAYVPNIFFIAVIILVTHYFLKVIRFFFAEIGKETISLPGFFPEWSDPTFKIIRFLVIAFAAVMAYPYFPGSESPAFKGISIFLGVLLSLGSTSAVANTVAGVILTYMRAFKIGDRVQMGDTIGDVVEKTLLITRIKTIKNVDVTIPNSLVLGNHIINFSSSVQRLILHTSVTIGYDAPWRTVE